MRGYSETRSSELKRLKALIHYRAIERRAQRYSRRKKSARCNHGFANIRLFYESRLLYLLKTRDFYRSFPNRQGSVVIDIPILFSFSDNPDNTINTIQKLLFYGTNKYVNELVFNHEHCQEIEIAASTVMDVVLMEILKAREKQHQPLNLRGIYPSDKKLRDFLEINGILKHIGIGSEPNSAVRKLDLISGDYRSRSSGLAATRIIHYINECLKTQGFHLSREGEGFLGQLLGEVINNCELHGGEFSRWYSLGYYRKDDERKYGECQLVIFSIGDTIYQSLKNNSSSEETISSLRKLSSKHLGFFAANRWTEDSLWTLYLTFRTLVDYK
ncbi:MAG: hypothetical protein ACM3ZC_15805 [Bacteroidota bacterium]